MENKKYKTVRDIVKKSFKSKKNNPEYNMFMMELIKCKYSKIKYISAVFHNKNY